ncbi:hypothetical protein ACQ4PT_013978 [Festuca glaucescens]
MARVEDLTDEQFDELCRQFKPISHYDIAADDSDSEIAADDAYPDDSDTAVDDLFQDSYTGARPACGLAIATLPAAVAGEATRERQCAVCMEAFMEGQELRMPCPKLAPLPRELHLPVARSQPHLPVCRFELPPAVEETDDDTDTAAEETVTGSDAETYEDESGDTEVSDFASEIDSSTETDTESDEGQRETGRWRAPSHRQ